MKNVYRGNREFDHRTAPKVGVLLTNLGTPDAPTAKALRVYLREFLSDPRVIELPRLLWFIVLNLFILPFRPRKSAALYREVWTEEGSPLLVTSRLQARLLQTSLNSSADNEGLFQVALGMRYGNPSIEAGLEELRPQYLRQLIVLPLYPQYSGSTSGSTFDAVSHVLSRWRYVPTTSFVSYFHDHPAYISALAESIRRFWKVEGTPDMVVFSYHGIPQRYFDNGDPYFCHCHKTTRLVAEALSLPRERYVVAFQSLFGKEEWIKPYTASLIQKLASQGVKNLHVVAPGFPTDCLETLEEINVQFRELFLKSGGTKFEYIPALNSGAELISLLSALVREHLVEPRYERPAADRVVEVQRQLGVGRRE